MIKELIVITITQYQLSYRINSYTNDTADLLALMTSFEKRPLELIPINQQYSFTDVQYIPNVHKAFLIAGGVQVNEYEN